MKKMFLTLVVILHVLPLSALSLSFGIDAASALSFAYGTTGVAGECAVRLDDHFRTTLGLGWYSTGRIDDDVSLFNTALSADYFPFDSIGLYVGVGLADVFFPFGLDAGSTVRFSSHLRFGYAWDLPYFTLDVRLNLRDPVGSGGEDTVYLQSKIGQLGRLSCSCLLSFRYDFK